MKIKILFASISLGLAQCQYTDYPGVPAAFPPTTPTSGPTTSPANPTQLPSSSNAGQGDTQCLSLICVSAIVNTNNTVTYVLQSTNRIAMGWMAIGFGSQMPDTPMVILWPNPDGSVTLSQRQAGGHIMPTVVSNPPRVASLVSSLTVVGNSANPKMSFSVPANSDRTQNLIWAFGATRPSSAAVDSPLVQHVQSGLMTLDLTKQSASFDPAAPSTSPGGGNGNPGSPSTTLPLLYYQKLIAAHAALCGIGFIILLPIGALVGRYLRTFTPHWFKGHALVQFWISGPIILTGFALGIAGTADAKAPHFNDTHKRLGLVLVIAYLVQCGLGAFIHFIKDANRVRRPPQNYLHAVFGLAIIVISFYQVHLGYDDEWEKTTGRNDVPSGVGKAWVAIVVIVSIAYVAGLGLLFRQFRQEREDRAKRLGSSLNN